LIGFAMPTYPLNGEIKKKESYAK